MRTECPTCNATYDIPDHLLVKGRRTRCARCGRDWMPVPSELESMEIALDDSQDSDPQIPLGLRTAEHPPNERLSITSTPTSAPLALKAAWGTSIAALALLAVATIVWRDNVMRLWPASQHILGTTVASAPAPSP